MYKLTTSDPFFFRGNGDFNAGMDSFTTRIFPPHAQTLYGALRSNYISQYGDLEQFQTGKMAQEIGTPTAHGALQIHGVFLALHDELYIPAPQDIQVIDTKNAYQAQRLHLCKGSGRESDHQRYRFVAPKNEKSESASGKWLAMSDWSKYVSGETFPVHSMASFIIFDEKIGIARNPETRTVEEGMLYQYRRQYLKPEAAIVLDVTLPQPLSSITMGNKGTWWYLQKDQALEKQYQQFLQLQAQESDFEKANALAITLFTPALIKTKLTDAQGVLRFNQMQVLQSITDRPQYMGGWDLHLKRPKPRVPLLAAGTTWIFDKPSHFTSQQLNQLRQIYYTDQGIESGYGRVILSPVNRERENDE